MTRASKMLATAATAGVLAMTAGQASAALIYSGDPPGGTNSSSVAGPDAALASHYDDGAGGRNNLGQGLDTGLAVPTDFTMSAFVNLDDANGDNMVFGTTAGAPLHLGFRGSDAYFGFWGNDSNATGGAPVGGWHHFTWTYDSTAQTQTIYEDGAQISTSSGHAPYGGGGTINIATTNGNGGDMNGALDDVRIYDTSSNAAAALAIYNNSILTDVPEPASLGILAIGGLGLLARRRRA